MPRYQSKSDFEAWAEAASVLPWWAAVLLGGFFYVVFHLIASIQLPKPTDVPGLGGFAGKQLIITIAMFLQYIVPVACLLGALGSAIKQARRERR